MSPDDAVPVPYPEPFARSFYDRPAAGLARALLGQLLIHSTDAGPRVARIVETEAYQRDDPASHSFRGPTLRNRSMFGPPGTLYVFRIHQVVCANAVARRGEAVLLRAGEPVTGVDGSPRGPGRLCRALGLEIRHDGLDLTDGPVVIRPGPTIRRAVAVGPRVGIRRAADRPLRFFFRDSPWVSAPRPALRGRAGRRRPT